MLYAKIFPAHIGWGPVWWYTFSIKKRVPIQLANSADLKINDLPCSRLLASYFVSFSLIVSIIDFASLHSATLRASQFLWVARRVAAQGWGPAGWWYSFRLQKISYHNFRFYSRENFRLDPCRNSHK